MQLATTGESEKQELSRVATRLQELGTTSNQVLIFLSFAIVAAVTYLTTALDPARRVGVTSSLRWWIGAIFPTVCGIIPLKEIKDGNLRRYRFMLWMRFVLMWAAILCIFIGAMQFFRAI